MSIEKVDFDHCNHLFLTPDHFRFKFSQKHRLFSNFELKMISRNQVNEDESLMPQNCSELVLKHTIQYLRFKGCNIGKSVSSRASMIE
jgi:hypothetical protein